MTQQYIEFITKTGTRVSLPIGQFGYNNTENGTFVFALYRDNYWAITESYDSFDARVMALT